MNDRRNNFGLGGNHVRRACCVECPEGYRGLNPGDGGDYELEQSPLPLISLYDCKWTSAHDFRSQRKSGALAPHPVGLGMGNYSEFAIQPQNPV